MKLKDLRKLNAMSPKQMSAYRAFKSVSDNGGANGFLDIKIGKITERWENRDNAYRLISIH